MGFLKDIVAMWQQLWRTNKVVFWVGAVGTLCSVYASLILNLTVNAPDMWTVLIFFLIGSISLTYNAYVMRDSWMILLMAWYTVINTIGIINLISGS